MKKDMTCVACPLGCQITVELEGNEVISVTGNTCKRGDAYARTEISNSGKGRPMYVPSSGSATGTESPGKEPNFWWMTSPLKKWKIIVPFPAANNIV